MAMEDVVDLSCTLHTYQRVHTIRIQEMNQLPDHAVTFVLYPILQVEFGITGVINHFLQ